MFNPEAAGSEGSRYEAELARIRLRPEIMLNAVGASNTERGLCARDDAAPIGPGIYAYNGLVTSLSRQLRDEDWTRVNVSGVLPIMLNPEARVALGVTSGDRMTGRRGRQQPKSRYAKGELTRKIIGRNVSPGQLELESPEFPKEENDQDQLTGYNLWMMLVFYDRDLKEIRYEVSLPERLSSKGRIQNWYHRVVPDEPYSVDSEIFDFGDDEDPNDGFGPTDVPVEPR
ncbi:hypothetical protein [Streptomyces otsuchiensis]|uniref:hypothetical protein n=1 Tax=Streptomyces otsuchiensis TaxID=2681388 RepID=UPI00102F46C2|nr:hypothetical protein [Streptomyces otsuchiensis]